jgi:hypothetical protein
MSFNINPTEPASCLVLLSGSVIHAGVKRPEGDASLSRPGVSTALDARRRVGGFWQKRHFRRNFKGKRFPA